MTAPPSQQKPSITRARTGCVACKKMRRRCDEQKPECSLCKRRSRPCIYEPPKVLVFDGSESQKQGQTLFRPLSLDHCDDHRRIKGFQYFTEKIIPNVARPAHQGGPEPQVSGNFSSFVAHHAKYSRTQEPALDYLISALSSVHGASWGITSSFTSVFYFDCISRALERLKDMKQGDETVIASCTLLGICEQVRTGDLKANSPYMSIALKILEEWKTRPDAELSDRRRMLIQRLLPALLVSREANNEAQSLVANPETYVPPSFISLQVAENALYDRIMRWIIPRAVTHTSPSTTWVTPCPDSTVNVVFDGWQMSFAPLESKPGPRSQRENVIMTMLRSHYLMSKLVLNYLSEPLDAPYRKDFVDKSSFILTALESLPSNETGLAPISVIAPAFFIAIRARDASHRTRALSLLESTEWIEGAWSSAVAHIIARAVVELGSVKENVGRPLTQRVTPSRASPSSTSSRQSDSPGASPVSVTSSASSMSRGSRASAQGKGRRPNATQLQTSRSEDLKQPKETNSPSTSTAAQAPRTPNQFLSPSQSSQSFPHIRPESTDCYFDRSTVPATAKLTLKYTTTNASGTPQLCTKLIIVTSESEVAACEKIAWPLGPIVKSWGYLRSDTLPVPYAASDVVVIDRVTTKMLEMAGRA